MPWCDDCSKFWNPPEMGKDGTCPSCGRRLGSPAAQAGHAAPVPPVNGREGLRGEPQPDEGLAVVGASPASSPATARAKGAPWHFKLLLLGVTVYMVYRVYWLIEWLPKHI